MFNFRSNKKELLDLTDLPKKDLFRNLKELDLINRYLGGHAISVNALEEVLSKIKFEHIPHLADIGCGGGDSLRAFARWKNKSQISITLTGIDLKEDCIEFCVENSIQHPEISFIRNDYRLALEEFKVDIVHSALFCHHLEDGEIIDLIRFCLDKKVILVINDLERNPFAYYAIKWITKLFSTSYLVKNDAPLSVLRGFKKKEWKFLIQRAGAVHFSVKNKWAFRHLIIIYS